MIRTASAVSALVLTAGLAGAQVTQFTSTLLGSSEVPANTSPATGTVLGSYDASTSAFSFSWTISGLVGTPSVCHIHEAPVGVSGPVRFGFNSAGPTYPLVGSATWTGMTTANVTALFSGNLYFNFHTSSFPGGEIRGQINVVPTPAAAGLLGIAGLASTRRRRG